MNKAALTKSISKLSLIFLITALFVSCRKTPSAPPVKQFATGPSITIEQLRSMWNGLNYQFTSNTILTAVVTADETSGQLYKQVYLRDNSGTFSLTHNYGAIVLRCLSSTNGFLYQGDSIAINLNGSLLDASSGGALQIDSVMPTMQIKHLKSGLNTPPIIATLPQLNTFSNGRFIFDAQLVQLNNVEFISPNVGTTYATPSSTTVNVTSSPPVNVNKYVCDFLGNTTVAYNSGYSNFAGQVIPSNSGTITAISNLYNTMQLNIRSYQDANLSAPYVPIVYDTITQNFSCGGLYSKNEVMTAGWKNFDLQGSLFWQGASYGVYPNYKYSPTVSNYKTTTTRNDIWLVSPPIKDNAYPGTSGTTKYVDFSTAFTYGTNARLLSVLVSRSFDGTHLIPSQWTDISALFPYIPNNSSQTSSGFPNLRYVSNLNPAPLGGFTPSPIPLSVGTSGTGSTPYFYLAFRYQSSTNGAYPDSSGSTYFLGSLVLRNQ